MSSETSNRCQKCGTPADLSDNDTLCPGCLLSAALHFGVMADEENSDLPLGDCDGYQLEKIIGRGGHGVVFLASKNGSAEKVAIKMLASAHLAGPDELRRFRLEAESVLDLAHRHIVRIRAVGENEGAPYFVMDYAERETLADRLTDRKGVQLLDATHEISLLAKVARAVHFAHERGVLHRDLKPANILIDRDDEPLVSDFGLARLIHAPAGLTLTGAALGTPAYMSPEQATGSRVTTASDVYSLGAILYQLLTGRPPFLGESPLDILRKVIAEDCPDPRQFAPWMDRDLTMICLKALRREPSGRYRSAITLADDLERWQRGEAVSARPLSFYEKLRKWCARHPIKTTLGFTGSLAVITLLGMFVYGSFLIRVEKDNAVLQEGIARASAKEARRTRDDFQLNAYAGDLYLGYRAFEEGHLGKARDMLARHLPSADRPDLRGFEWYALSNLCKGDDLISWKDHVGPIAVLTLSPDGQTLASAGRDGKVIFRNFPSGEIIANLPRPDAPKGPAEIPLITWVTSRSAEMSQLLLSAKLNPDRLRQCARPSKLGDISTLAWSPESTHFLTAGLGSYVRIWSMPEGNLVGLIPQTNTVNAGFSGDGKLIYLFVIPENSNTHELRIYQRDQLALLNVVPQLRGAHALTQDGNAIIVSPLPGNHLELHDLAGIQAVERWETGVELKQLVLSNDGQTLFGAESSGAFIGTWRRSDRQRTGQVFPIAGQFNEFSVSPDGKKIAATGSTQSLTVQSVQGDSPAAFLRGHEDTIHSLIYSRDGSYLITAGNDQTCRVWPANPAPPEPPAAQVPPTSSPNPIAARTLTGEWSGDGLSRGKLQFRNSSGDIRSFDGPPSTYLRLAASSDSSRVAAFCWPRDVRIFSLTEMQWGDPIPLSNGIVGPILFSKDGSLLISGGNDNAISIHESATGKLLKVVRGHQGTIVDLAISQDEKTLASSSQDGTLRLWHSPTWRDLGTLHRGEILSQLAFSDDGQSLRALGPDNTPRVFQGTRP